MFEAMDRLSRSEQRKGTCEEVGKKSQNCRWAVQQMPRLTKAPHE